MQPNGFTALIDAASILGTCGSAEELPVALFLSLLSAETFSTSTEKE